jgi:hypothetical protein
MSLSQQRRNRAFYWVVILLPLAVNAAFIASGSFGEYLSAFANGRMPTADYWTWTLICAVSAFPLFFAAWELGRTKRGARLLGYETIAGLRDVFLLAIGRDLTVENPLESRRSPKDSHRLALAIAAAHIVFVPTFFLSAIPGLRTTRGVVWLVGAGAAMGAGAYFHRRAVAYLEEEPRYWDILRQFRLLNPKRYEPAGRIFVRAQLISFVVLLVWWLVIGPAFVLFNP